MEIKINTSEEVLKVSAEETSQQVNTTNAHTERTVAASSWNDLTDKPFDVKKTVILPEITVVPNMDDGSMTLTEPFLEKLEAGKTYTVSWNGTMYKCVALEVDIDGLSLCLGNVGALGAPGIDDTGEPFAFIALPDAIVSDIGIYGAVYALDGSTDAVISIEHVIEKINPELLPDNIGGGASSWNDLKDKPFGEVTITEIVFMSARTVEVDPEAGEGMITDPLEHMPIADEVYTVNWNGVNYVCTAQAFSMEGISAIALGNLGAMTGEGDTGEPFIMLVLAPEIATAMGAYAGVYILDGSASITVSISSIVKAESKLDNKYLDLFWLPTETADVETEWVPESQTTDIGYLSIAATGADLSRFIPGKKAAVYVDGQRYESKIISNDKAVFLGSVNILKGDYNPDMPFLIYGDANDGIMSQFMPAGVHTVSIAFIEYGPNKLPMQFLPDSVPTRSYVDTAVANALAKFSNAEEASF